MKALKWCLEIGYKAVIISTCFVGGVAVLNFLHTMTLQYDLLACL